MEILVSGASEAECEAAVDAIRAVFAVTAVDGPYLGDCDTALAVIRAQFEVTPIGGSPAGGVQMRVEVSRVAIGDFVAGMLGRRPWHRPWFRGEDGPHGWEPGS